MNTFRTELYLFLNTFISVSTPRSSINSRHFSPINFVYVNCFHLRFETRTPSITRANNKSQTDRNTHPYGKLTIYQSMALLNRMYKNNHVKAMFCASEKCLPQIGSRASLEIGHGGGGEIIKNISENC